MHHSRRLAVTAGATVLGLAAMSGVGHADTGSGSPLADLTSSLTGAVGGLTGALTGSGGSAPSKKPAGSTGSSAPAAAPKPVSKPTVVQQAAAPKVAGSANAPSVRKNAAPVKKKPGHLKVEGAPELDLKNKTVSGTLSVDAGLRTLLGPVGLTIDTGGRLSAEDLDIGDPEGDGRVAVGADVLGLDVGVGAGGGAVVRPGEIGAGGGLGVCVGNCAPEAPTPPPAPGPPGGGTPPPSTPGLPELPGSPSQPSTPGLPVLPIGGTPPQADAAPPPKDLPITGTDSISLAVIGLAAVAAGGAAMASTRRRRTQED